MLQTISPHSTLFERPLNFVQKLQANVSYMHEYRQACLLAFTETWLVCHVQDSNLLIDGFGTPIIPYKNKCDTGKDHPGGYVSILTQYGAIQLLVALHAGHCTPVGVTPAILSTKGIPPAFFFTLVYVYIHPRTDFTSYQQTRLYFPDAPKFVLGDFNHCPVAKR